MIQTHKFDKDHPLSKGMVGYIGGQYVEGAEDESQYQNHGTIEHLEAEAKRKIDETDPAYNGWITPQFVKR